MPKPGKLSSDVAKRYKVTVFKVFQLGTSYSCYDSNDILSFKGAKFKSKPMYCLKIH